MALVATGFMSTGRNGRGRDGALTLCDSYRFRDKQEQRRGLDANVQQEYWAKLPYSPFKMLISCRRSTNSFIAAALCLFAAACTKTALPGTSYLSGAGNKTILNKGRTEWTLIGPTFATAQVVRVEGLDLDAAALITVSDVPISSGLPSTFQLQPTGMSYTCVSCPAEFRTWSRVTN